MSFSSHVFFSYSFILTYSAFGANDQDWMDGFGPVVDGNSVFLSFDPNSMLVSLEDEFIAFDIFGSQSCDKLLKQKQ